MISAGVKTLDDQAIVATDLTKWFGEGETKVTAVNGVALVAHFGEMLFIVGPLGVGFVMLMIMIARSRLPNYAATITFWNLGLAFGMVVLIAGISSYVGVRKVLKIEPFDIFRG